LTLNVRVRCDEFSLVEYHASANDFWRQLAKACCTCNLFVSSRV
jgi:hypothetical protein